MSDCPMLISNKLHSFRNFDGQNRNIVGKNIVNPRKELQGCSVSIKT